MVLFRFLKLIVYIIFVTGWADASKTTTNSKTNIRGTTTVPTKVTTTTDLTKITGTSSSSSSDDIRVLFTVSDNSSYYNINAKVGESEVGLRLDIIQPDVWVMDNGSFYYCDELRSYYSSIYSMYSTLSYYPSSVTDSPEYTATACAMDGLYTEASSASEPQVSGIYNGENYFIPYIDTIEANGYMWTDNFLINSTSGICVSMSNFSFINVFSTSVYTGGFGIAGNPKGSGFLNSLVDQGFIQSPGYSLWFSNTSFGDSIAELIPGGIDTSLIDGDFYTFDVLNHTGWRFDDNDQANEDLENIVLPLLPLEDLFIENEKTAKTRSILGDSNVPVLLDSRSTYTYLPLDTIVTLAVQTGAIYSSELQLWLVECDKIVNSNATLNFNFTDITIKIGINNFLSEYEYLSFSNGASACILEVLPDDFMGFSSLGLPFLNAIYLAMDNEGKKIGIGKAKDKVVHKSDFNFEHSITLSHSSMSLNTSTNTVSSTTFGLISSGYIPFGTPANITSYPTFTYTTYNESGSTELGIPTGLSASIKSSKIYTNDGTTSTIGSAVSAASGHITSKTVSAAAAAGRIPPIKLDIKSKGVFAYGYGFVLTILIICISMF